MLLEIESENAMGEMGKVFRFFFRRVQRQQIVC